ncbi:hypothetical protein ACFQ2B_32075 [Streptomyces stramineus]
MDLITEQGEGGTAERTEPCDGTTPEMSHFRTFLRIGELLTTERVPGPAGCRCPGAPPTRCCATRR